MKKVFLFTIAMWGLGIPCVNAQYVQSSTTDLSMMMYLNAVREMN